MLSSLLVVMVLAQSGTEPPLVPIRAPLPAGAVLASEKPELERYGEWLEANLVRFDEGVASSGLTVGGKHVKLVDDDLAKAFSLVPSAAELVTPIPGMVRTASTLQIVGMIPMLGGLILLELIPLLGLAGVVLPLVALATLLTGLGLLLPGMIVAMNANNRLARAVNEYNFGLVRMRPGSPAPWLP